MPAPGGAAAAPAAAELVSRRPELPAAGCHLGRDASLAQQRWRAGRCVLHELSAASCSCARCLRSTALFLHQPPKRQYAAGAACRCPCPLQPLARSRRPRAPASALAERWRCCCPAASLACWPGATATLTRRGVAKPPRRTRWPPPERRSSTGRQRTACSRGGLLLRPLLGCVRHAACIDASMPACTRQRACPAAAGTAPLAAGATTSLRRRQMWRRLWPTARLPSAACASLAAG